MMSSIEQTRLNLAERFGQESVTLAEYAQKGYHLLVSLQPPQASDLAEFLQQQQYFLEFVTAVDRHDHLEVVYMYGRFDQPCRIKAVVLAPKGTAVPSIARIMPTANWHERETAEFLGQDFAGHPDLRNLLLPEEADFHPLLKDFKAPPLPDEVEDWANYHPSFAQEVYAEVDSGEQIKTCMQCGVCAASCPLAQVMDFSPRKIFALIRAGRREKVMSAQGLLLCTSCYSCKVRCPRQIPVIDVMHGLAHYAIENGYLNRPETINFGRAFWKSIYKLGRVDETLVPVNYLIADGLDKGLEKMRDFTPMGLGLFFHKRMNALPRPPISGYGDLRRMLDKAGGVHLRKESAA